MVSFLKYLTSSIKPCLWIKQEDIMNISVKEMRYKDIDGQTFTMISFIWEE